MSDIGIGGFAWQVGFVLIGTCLVVAYPLVTYGSQRLVWGLAAGSTLAVLNVVAGCTAITWAFNRSRTTFFQAVFGSLGLRMILIGLSVFVLIKYTDIHVSGFIWGLFGFYVVFQVMEVIFLVKRLPPHHQEN